MTVSSFERNPKAAATLDGLGISSVDTAKMLLSRLKEAKEQEMAARLNEAMDRLDPLMLELPAYEREVQDRPTGNRRGRDDRRGPQ